jgi:hypothetical protein
MDHAKLQIILSVATLSVLPAVACRSGDSTRPTNASNSSAASSPAARPSAAPVRSKIDACSLLSSDDLKAVQGEAFKDAQRSDRLDGDFIVAQCYYAMPTLANSIVLNVTTAREEPGAPQPKAFWEKTFGGDEEKEREGERDRERDRNKPTTQSAPRREEGEEGEAKEAAPPERVKGLGDEAFWVASPVGGAIYVLKKDIFFRISVGGAGDQRAKLSKSKSLALKIVTKLDGPE